MGLVSLLLTLEVCGDRRDNGQMVPPHAVLKTREDGLAHSSAEQEFLTAAAQITQEQQKYSQLERRRIGV